ncbi:MAG: divalent-cation tolerance protein CutA [Pseudomonadota bacterium]
MQGSPQIVLCTVPDRDTAEMIAGTLVSDRQAACVNIIAGLTSVYRWQNKTEQSDELLLIIKTTENAYESAQATISRLHPYELPEIIAVTIQNGLPEYLDWLTTSLETP